MKSSKLFLSFDPDKEFGKQFNEAIFDEVSSEHFKQTFSEQQFIKQFNKLNPECVIFYIKDESVKKITTKVMNRLKNYSGDVFLVTKDESMVELNREVVTDNVIVNNKYSGDELVRRVAQMNELYQLRSKNTRQNIISNQNEFVNTVEDFDSTNQIVNYIVDYISNFNETYEFAWIGKKDDDTEEIITQSNCEKHNLIPKSVHTNCDIQFEELNTGSVPHIITESQQTGLFTDNQIEKEEYLFTKPLMYRNDVYGFIFVNLYDYTKLDVQMLDFLSNIASIAIFNAKYENENSELNDEIKELEKRIEQFMSVITHDLRNPLNTAQGYTNMYEEDSNDSHLRWVKKAHSRIEQLISDMIHLLRFGEKIVSFETHTIGNIAEDAWKSIDTQNTKVNINSTAEVEVSYERCKKLLEILFTNAIQHNNDTITINVGDVVEDGDIIGFYVEDNGRGIPKNSSKDIFEHGYSTTNNGTGLGLTIVKIITDVHDWKIEAVSLDEIEEERKSRGARFNILF